jgi:glycosyltransferase involved in cell wall biosynthesis
METSCIAAIEAMSAGCAVVCPNYGALPETTGGLATIYPWSEDNNYHANQFANVLKVVIDNFWHEGLQGKLQFTKTYADNMYNWDIRIEEWIALLKSL